MVVTDLFLFGPPILLAIGTSIVAWLSVRSSRRYIAEAEAERRAHAK